MMDSPSRSQTNPGRWTSLWVVALLSLLAQLSICQFFTFGQRVPMTIDINPSNLWKFVYEFPPAASFRVLNWLGTSDMPQPLNPFSLGTHLSPWWFFTLYAPVMATLSLLAMAAFLRELELPRPAALFGAVIYAWQGDLLPFVFPAHFPYITTWPFYAIAAWGALRAHRTKHWAYAVISGAGCGIMVELQPDRGGIASLLIAALYLAPVLRRPREWKSELDSLRHLALCVGVAVVISFASILSLVQGNIEGVTLGGKSEREQTYKFVTQFSLGPEETLSYLVPGFFGWHINNNDGPYWGQIGRSFDYPKNGNSTRNLNLAISTTGTIATALALIGIVMLLPGRLLGPARLTERQLFYGRVLLGLGAAALVLSWGWHTPLYRAVFMLPLMDKWRNPLKWLEMTNFAMITLSALGAQQLIASLQTDLPDLTIIRRRLSEFSGGLLILLGLGLLASYPYSLYVLPQMLQKQGYELGAIANIMATLHTSLFVALAVMALFCVLLFALWRPDWLRRAVLPNPLLHRLWQKMLQPDYLPLTLSLGLIALSVSQLDWVTGQFVRSVDLHVLTDSNPLLEQLRTEGDQVRVSVATDDPLLDMMLLNQFNSARISSLEVSAASRIPDDINTFFNGPLRNFQGRLWFLAGVKNVAIPQDYINQLKEHPDILSNIDHVDGYTLEPTSSTNLPSHALVQMRDYLAKATYVPSMDALPRDKLLERLKDPSWNPRERVLFQTPVTISMPKAQPPPSATDIVKLKTYTPTEIEIDAQTARSGFILINDQYDPDWQVLVNGEKTKLLRADFLLRAIPVAAGMSHIEMHYIGHYHVGPLELPVTAMNIFCDGAMLAAWLVAGLALWPRRVL